VQIRQLFMIASSVYGEWRCRTGRYLELTTQSQQQQFIGFAQLGFCRLSAAKVLIIGGDGLAAEV
jgi:hypothetical protein